MNNICRARSSLTVVTGTLRKHCKYNVCISLYIYHKVFE